MALLKAARQLRALLRDRLLAVPACAAAAPRGDDATAAGCAPCHPLEGPASGYQPDAATSCVAADTGPAGCHAKRHKQQRTAAACRTLAAMAAWHAGLDVQAQALIAAAASTAGRPAPPGATGPGIGGGAAGEVDGQAAGPSLDAHGLACQFMERRRAVLIEELTSAEAAARRTPTPTPQARREQLLSAIAALRRSEATLAFHSRLARAATTAAATASATRVDFTSNGQLLRSAMGSSGSHCREHYCGCREATFAYGSTPLASWLGLYLRPSVWAAVHMAMHGHEPADGSCAADGTQPRRVQAKGAASSRECSCGGGSNGDGGRFLVWGSSSGWLVFYAALAFGWQGRCRGVELLPCLVAEARRVAAEVGITGACTGLTRD
jgi:hypothetical protein